MNDFMNEDFTGEKLGKLTVLEPAEVKNDNITKWLCQCDCGNTVVVSSAKIRDGNIKSCGCLKKTKKDLTGQRFGDLVVVGEHGKTAAGNVVWECMCDCGNTSYHSGTNLLSGSSSDCGCKSKKALEDIRNSIIGERFGRLIAIREVRREGKKVIWECKCDCGNTAYVSRSSLISGNTKSCGCLRPGRKPYGGLTRSKSAELEAEWKRNLNQSI